MKQIDHSSGTIHHQCRNKPFVLVIMTVFGLIACQSPEDHKAFNPVRYVNDQNAGRNRPFDSSWKFQRGEADGAENPGYDDSEWRVLDLPHDWSIEDLPAQADTFPGAVPKPVGPFSPGSPGDISTGFTIGGTGWYRKAFTLRQEDIEKVIHIRFDGIYMNASVWINGHILGNHPYGYTPFFFDLTPFLMPAGQPNILAVRVRNEGRNSRWYSGSGIYRHVWMDVTDKVFIKTWGVKITTPEVADTMASVKITTAVRNLLDTIANLTVKSRLIAPDGRNGDYLENRSTLFPLEEGVYGQNIPIKNPVLWSPESPNLYVAEVSIYMDNTLMDSYLATFGIRKILFDAEHGFTLNGREVLLRGGNLHHDNGPLGSAAIDRAEYRRVEIMKANGYNAIRTSHNPPSGSFLDACDELGMLVLDEAFDMWQRPKNPQDYHLYYDDWWKQDLGSMVLRDRNHPSVILWSIGNEVNERADSSGLILARKMYDHVKSLDDTRPVTEAICGFWDHPGKEWPDTAPAFAILDVGGYNYQWENYEPDHAQYPHRIMAGTESIVLEAYDNWEKVKEHPYVIGDFLWTGMDYLGEASIGHAVYVKKGERYRKSWPWFNAWCGDIDLCGFKKPQSLYRDVVWDLSRIEMVTHAPVPDGLEEEISYWGWPDVWQNWNWDIEPGRPVEVTVYTGLPEVVLMLNGKEAGRQTNSATNKRMVRFNVPYEPGQLKAVGLKDGIPVDSSIIETTGLPVAIRLLPERNAVGAGRNELCYIRAEVVDEKGRYVSDAERKLNFEIGGQGALAAVANGNPTDIKSFQRSYVNTFRGKCLVIVRPVGLPGSITVSASGEGLKGSSVTIGITE